MATPKDVVLELCAKNGIKSIRQLERACGVSYNVISKWDKFKPSADNLFKVADFFNVSTDFILSGGAEEMLPSANTPNEKQINPLMASGDNEVLLLDNFRKLSTIGKYKILIAIEEELKAEQPDSEEKDDAASSTSIAG